MTTVAILSNARGLERVSFGAELLYDCLFAIGDCCTSRIAAIPLFADHEKEVADWLVELEREGLVHRSGDGRFIEVVDDAAADLTVAVFFHNGGE